MPHKGDDLIIFVHNILKVKTMKKEKIPSVGLQPTTSYSVIHHTNHSAISPRRLIDTYKATQQ